jgi:hypothetical protein
MPVWIDCVPPSCLRSANDASTITELNGVAVV